MRLVCSEVDVIPLCKIEAGVVFDDAKQSKQVKRSATRGSLLQIKIVSAGSAAAVEKYLWQKGELPRRGLALEAKGALRMQLKGGRLYTSRL